MKATVTSIPARDAEKDHDSYSPVFIKSEPNKKAAEKRLFYTGLWEKCLIRVYFCAAQALYAA